MKKIYSVMAAASLFALAAMMPQDAFAGAATYENHVVTLTGVPDGAGIVYLETNWNNNDAEWNEIDEMLYEEDEITVRATIETKNNKANCHLYAIPNEGYEFAGFFIDEDGDDEFDIEFDVPITFSTDDDYDNKCIEKGAPRVYTSSPARQVVLTHEGIEYSLEGEGITSDMNKAAAEENAEADWEEQGCLNHFFAVFYKEGEENPVLTNVQAISIDAKEVMYNLCGQKVDKNFKGFVISGGKKKFIR